MLKNRPQLLLLLLGLCLVLPPCANANQATSKLLLQQRKQFLDAEQALKNSQLSRYRRMAKKLQNYPLYPYLEYQELVRRLSTARPQEITTFLQKNADTPLALRLRKKWLNVLVRQGKWEVLVEQYVPTRSISLQCSYARALLETNQAERAYQRLQTLWLTGRSLPRSCDEPIRDWKKSGSLSHELIWQRIRLAMQRGNVQLARHLAKDLPAKDHYLVNIWAKVRRDPGYIMEVNDHFADKKSYILDWITVYGLRRLTSRDPLQAAEYWQKLRQTHNFSVNDQERIERRLALTLLREHDPAARQWLKTLHLTHLDDRVISLHFFSALQDQDWDTALGWLERLDQSQQHTAFH